MIWASSVPGGSDVHSTLARWRRRRPSASFMAIRASQVERLGVATKTLEMRESPDIGFLHDVLGLAVVAQDAAGKPVKPAIIRLHDGANGRLVAGAGARDQFGVAIRDGSNLWGLGVAHDWAARSVDRLLLTVGCGKAK